jgi:hypothetical protein
MASLDDAYADIHRDHPFHSPPDFVAAVRSLIESAGLSIHSEENVMRRLMILALATVSVSCQSAAQDRAAQDRAAQDRAAQSAPPT